MAGKELLAVEGLGLIVAATGTKVVRGVSFTVAPDEIVGIVGESGSGKTLAARAIMALQPPAIRRAQVLDMLRRVGIQDPDGALTAYPHQFSGGMRQRIMLASVMLLRPALLIADEPTTGLDAVVRRDVLELMVELTRAHGTAVPMISHDLSMVARYTDRIIVMRKGEVVEQGSTESLLRAPRHPYTRTLLAAMPKRLPARAVPAAAIPLVEVRDLVVDSGGRQGLFRKEAGKRALHGVSLSMMPREVVALVGGSGSGKTTLGRAIAGLLTPGGGIRYAGRPITRGSEGWTDYRRNCQMVFQDPYSSLDPRMTIGALVGEALRGIPDMGRREKAARVIEVLREVGLGEPTPPATRTSCPAASANGPPSRVRWSAAPPS